MTSQEAPEASVEESKDEPEEEPAAEEEEEEEEEEDEEEIKDPKEELEEGSSIAPSPRLVLFLRNVVFEKKPAAAVRGEAFPLFMRNRMLATIVFLMGAIC